MPFGPIIVPMLVYVLWVAALYAVLTIVRAPSVWSVGRGPDGLNPWAHLEAPVSANLSNQFEWPLFFYIACVLGIVENSANSSPFLVAAWIFVAGRIIHSGVQILTKNIRLRGVVFTINFVAVLWMWGLLLV